MNRLLLAILVLLLAALAYHCLVVRPPQIEADVLARVESNLAGPDFSTVAVDVDGRDVLLTGTAPDRRTSERAASRADERTGARVVVNEIVVAPPPAPPDSAAPAAAYRTRLCIDRDGVRVDGSVPDAAAAGRYRSIAAERLGEVPVSTDLEYRANPPTGHGRVLTVAFAELAQLDSGCIEIEDAEVRVSGQVRSTQARDRIVADLDRAAGRDFRTRYDLVVPRLSDAALACQEALDALLAPEEIVLFEFDSAELSAQGRAVLDEAEAIWERCPDISLIVAGHTDSDGDAEYNRALSERRANAVVDYLVEQGLLRSKLTPIGFGEAQPRASNESEAGRALNRRMEFRVKEDAQ